MSLRKPISTNSIIHCSLIDEGTSTSVGQASRDVAVTTNPLAHMDCEDVIVEDDLILAESRKRRRLESPPMVVAAVGGAVAPFEDSSAMLGGGPVGCSSVGPNGALAAASLVGVSAVWGSLVVSITLRPTPTTL